MDCDHKFAKDSTWYCVHCGVRAPACFTPKPEAMAVPDNFVAEHFVVIEVK